MDSDLMENEVKQVVDSVPGNCVKVVLETDQLTENEVIKACNAACAGGCEYVKTSTGVNGKANFKVVRLLRKTAPGNVKIKAAGGIRTYNDAKEYIT
eukprot:UN07667